MPLPATAVRFDPAMERTEPDEAGTLEGLRETFQSMLDTTSRDYGHAVRGVHAKGHGIVRGTLAILPNLPPELAQGLFDEARDYDAILRFSTNPADILDDSVVLPRGVALKVIGVEGTPEGSQDFVMVDGPAFFAGTGKFFLQNLKLLAASTDKAEFAKKAQSFLLRGIENALETVGLESATLKSLGGTPSIHPLGRTYYSQTAFLYGDYVAKFSLAPVSDNLTSLADAKVAVAGRADALREDIREALIESDSQWELRVQLCTDPERMPVEDPSKLWDEKESPFVAVARLTIPAQVSWQAGESEKLEDSLFFSPWHCLAAHRPLGAINRLRQPIYQMSADFRSRFNGCPIHHGRVPAESVA